jgi:hypothetical protein
MTPHYVKSFGLAPWKEDTIPHTNHQSAHNYSRPVSHGCSNLCRCMGSHRWGHPENKRFPCSHSQLVFYPHSNQEYAQLGPPNLLPHWIQAGATDSSPNPTTLALGSTQPPIQWVPQFFPGVKEAGEWSVPLSRITLKLCRAKPILPYSHSVERGKLVVCVGVNVYTMFH